MNDVAIFHCLFTVAGLYVAAAAAGAKVSTPTHET